MNVHSNPNDSIEDTGDSFSPLIRGMYVSVLYVIYDNKDYIIL